MKSERARHLRLVPPPPPLEDTQREAETEKRPDEHGHERQDAPVLTSDKPHRNQSEAV